MKAGLHLEASCESEQKGKLLAGSGRCIKLFKGVIYASLCFPATSAGLRVREINLSHASKKQIKVS